MSAVITVSCDLRGASSPSIDIPVAYQLDLRALCRLKSLLEDSIFLDNVAVPHITSQIAEFAIGTIIQCEKCHREMHVLPSEMDQIKRVHFNHGSHTGDRAIFCNEHCQKFQCDQCFRHSLDSIDLLCTAWGLHYRFGYRSNTVPPAVSL